MTPFSAFIRVVVILLCLQSCSNLNRLVRFTPDYDGVHPHLKPIVDEVKRLSKGCLGNAKYVGFFDKVPDHPEAGKSIIGMANWVLPFFDAQININSDWWYGASKVQKVLLMAHEMYHAEKPYLGHIEDIDDWGCATHFMYPSVQSHWCDSVNYEKYIKQMQDCR